MSCLSKKGEAWVVCKMAGEACVKQCFLHCPSLCSVPQYAFLPYISYNSTCSLFLLSIASQTRGQFDIFSLASSLPHSAPESCQNGAQDRNHLCKSPCPVAMTNSTTMPLRYPSRYLYPSNLALQYSMYGHIKTLAEAEKKGIESAGGSVDIYQ